MSRIDIKLNEKVDIITRTINGNNLILTFTPGSFILLDDKDNTVGEIPIEIDIDNTLKIAKDSKDGKECSENTLKFILNTVGYNDSGEYIFVSKNKQDTLKSYFSRVSDLFIEDDTIDWINDLFRASGVLDKSIIGESASLLYKLEDGTYAINLHTEFWTPGSWTQGVLHNIKYDFRKHEKFIDDAIFLNNTRGVLFSTYPLAPYLRRFVMCYGDIFGDTSNIVYNIDHKRLIRQMKIDIMSSKFHGRSATISKMNLYMNKNIPLFELRGRYKDENGFVIDYNETGRLAVMLSFEKKVIALDELNSVIGVSPILYINRNVVDENDNILLNRGDIFVQNNLLKVLENRVDFNERDMEDLKLIGEIYYKLISLESGYSTNVMETLLTIHISIDDTLGISTNKIDGRVKLSRDNNGRIFYIISKHRNEDSKDSLKLFILNGLIFKVIGGGKKHIKSEIFNIRNTRLTKDVLKQFIEIDSLLKRLTFN